MAAISIPAEYVPVAHEDLLGDLKSGVDPLDTIGENVNYLYGHHSPPLWDICPMSQAAAHPYFIWAAQPSADSISYTIDLWLHVSGKTSGVDVTLQYGATDSLGGGAGWQNVTGWAPKTFTLASYPGLLTGCWVSATATLPAAARYWRMDIQDSLAVGNVQCQACMATPGPLSTVASGVSLASGFVAHEATMLDAAGGGGTVHPEFLNRIKRNRDSILRDRRQMVFSLCPETSGALTLTALSGTLHGVNAEIPTVPIFTGQTALYGQRGATIDVEARVADSAGTPGTIEVGELGGEAVVLDADNTDNSDTLTLHSDHPVFYASATPGTGGTITPGYIVGSWRPGD